MSVVVHAPPRADAGAVRELAVPRLRAEQMPATCRAREERGEAS